MSNIVKSIVSKGVARLGYRHSTGSNWQKDLPELIHLIGLQRSSWGGEYYIQLGVWMKVFGPDESPKYFQCHVQLRLSSTSGLEAGNIDDALQDEDLWKMDPDERSRIINGALDHARSEFFDKIRSLEDLRGFIGRKRGLQLAVDRLVKDYFGIPVD